MCDIEIPRECKRPVFDSALLESSAKAAAPSFDTMKRNIDRINSRLDQIKNDPSFKKTPIPMGLMKEYQQLLKKKENFLFDLKSHPDYDSFVKEMKTKREKTQKKNKNFQKLSDKEQEMFLSGMRQRSTPKRVRLLNALAKVNHAINNIKKDKYLCKNPIKKRSLQKLLKHRNKICRKLMKYPAFESGSFECFRFKPCKLKFVKAYKYEPKTKRGGRYLKFDYDDNLNRIGMPRYRTICDIIQKYKEMISALKIQMNFTKLKKEDDEELRKQKCSRLKQLKNTLKKCSKRRKILIELKKKIYESRVEKIKEKRAREDIEKVEKKTDEKKTFEIPPGYWESDQVKLFSRDLQVPRKHKLVEILRRQKELLKKIERIEKIEAGPKGLDENGNESDKTQGSNSKPEKSQNKEPSKKVTVEDVKSEEKTKHILLVRNKTDVRSLKAGIKSNIKFIREFLKSYPEPKLKLHSCNLVTEAEEWKKFDFEEKNDALNDFAMPRPRTLREVLKMYEEMLKKFEADVRNEKALNELKNGNDLTNSKRSGQKNKRKPQTKKSFKKPQQIDEQIDSLVPPGFRDDEANLSQPQTDAKVEVESQQVDGSNKKTNEKPVTKKDAQSSEKKLKCQAHAPSRFVIPCKQRKVRDLVKRQKMYKKLQNAKKKIEELIKLHEERIEQWNSPGKSGIRYYVHNKNCQKVASTKKPYEEYKMKGEYKKLSSMAKKAHMRDALKKLNENIKANLKIKYGEKKEIEEIIKALKEGKDCLLPQKIKSTTTEDSKIEGDIIGADIKKDANSKKARKDAKGDDNLQQNDADVPDGTQKLTPYLCRYLRRKINLEKSLKKIKNETVETVHDQSHKNSDAHFFPPHRQYFDFSIKREQNLEHTNKLAKPKTYVLQGTLNEFSKFMSHDKREGIKCTLNARMSQMMRPEDLEAQVREIPKPTRKRKNQNQACKLKNRVSKQLYEQLAKTLKKKIAEKMAQNRRGLAITQPIREVEKTIYMFLMAINGTPRSNQECEMYKKFTSVISEFLLSALQEKVEKKLETESEPEKLEK